ncbi:MAG: YlxR family protein [Anaerolineae bacterium]|nr:YlxR family protein [Anaerolineae bacterium]
MRKKHVPQRTCVGCREVKSKREMVRIVRTPEGEIVVDERGKMNGRGAYICATRSCWETVLKGSQLSQALNIDIGEAEKQVLRAYIDTLDQES